jgi:hypothetical protein
VKIVRQSFALCGAVVAAWATAAFAEEAPARTEFEIAEEGKLAAAAANDIDALLALARFYMANGLHVEARAALRRANGATAEFARLIAECDYRLARHEAVVEALAAVDPKDPLYAMALAHLGAYEDAAIAFTTADRKRAPEGLAADFNLAAAEAFAETGDVKAAAAALRLARDGGEPARRAFIAAKILSARGDASRAGAAFRRLATNRNDAWSMRARLALAGDDQDLAAAALQWRGGAFDRELSMMKGRRALARGDYKNGIDALRLVVDRFSRSDDARSAQNEIGAALPLLLADGRVGPKVAAEIFFENVDFAPPGREGDALIHGAATKLEALGLYAQAARLLDHQVFKRLRGAERATVAADLAELQLRAKAPAAALAVLRATRMAGLPAETNQRRRRLEARALSETGRAEAALTLLSSSPTTEDLRLRGAVNWSRKNWASAATDYASVVSASPTLDARADRDAAVRAATAYLLAGDRAGYRAFSKEAAARLGDAPEADLIASLGDVDREHFLARFMATYKSVYGAGES